MRYSGNAPTRVKYGGYTIVGISATDPSKVMIQMHDPDWWMEMTPEEARGFARLLISKAEELEKDLAAGPNN